MGIAWNISFELSPLTPELHAWGVDPTRSDDSHPNSSPLELQPKGLGHRLYHVLGAAVDRQARTGTHSRLAGDEHHLTCAAPHHVRQEGPGDVEGTPHIDADTLLPLPGVS